MSEEWEYVAHEDVDLEGALVVVAVPAVGMVGPITASFLVKHLDMRVIGGFQGAALPPAGIVRDGVVSSPVAAFTTEMACGPDGRCDRLVVVTSEVIVPADAMVALADAICTWAEARRVALLVGVDGYPVEKGKEAAVRLASSVGGREAAGRMKAEPLDATLLAGFTAALLVRANRHGCAAVGLLAPVDEPEGDADAAAGALAIVDPLVPNIHLKPEALRKEAEAAAARIADEQRRHDRATKRIEDNVHRGYV